MSTKDAKVLAMKQCLQLKKNEFACIDIPVNPVYRSYPKIYDPYSQTFLTLMGY